MLASGRSLTAVLALFTAVLSAHCAVPYFPEDDMPTGNDTGKKRTEGGGDETPVGTSTTAPSGTDTTKDTETEERTDGACTHLCDVEGAKRCSSTGSAGTEICKVSSDGCRKWTAGEDCAADYTCDKTLNDGTCKAGCINDVGCAASNVGSARCSSDGKTETTCSKSGACYVWKTTRTGVAQQCVSPTYCGPTTGRRMSCVASAAGACTQHVATFNDCPTGTACSGAGQCTATCTNDSGCSSANLYAVKCNGSRSRLSCQKSGLCYKWLATTACSPDETCKATTGSCVASCTNACTKNTTRCVAGSSRSTQICVTGSSGCTVWATGTSCSPDETCSNGVCN